MSNTIATVASELDIFLAQEALDESQFRYPATFFPGVHGSIDQVHVKSLILPACLCRLSPRVISQLNLPSIYLTDPTNPTHPNLHLYLKEDPSDLVQDVETTAAMIQRFSDFVTLYDVPHRKSHINYIWITYEDIRTWHSKLGMLIVLFFFIRSMNLSPKAWFSFVFPDFQRFFHQMLL
jgi:hypothetical protein